MDYIQLLRKKSQLIYDINSIKRYIEGMEYDHNLKEAWDQFNNELHQVEEHLRQIAQPQLKELEERKTDILGKVKKYEEELNKYRQQLKDIDHAILKLGKG